MPLTNPPTPVQFSATQITSADVNSLDDYEEGTWTPVAKWATVGTSTWTPTVQVGRYTKIGHRVFVDCSYEASQTKGTGSGTLSITGLPFTVLNLASYYPYGIAQLVGWTQAGVGNYGAYGVLNTTTAVFQYTGTGSLNAAFAASHFAAGPASIFIYFSFSYEV